MNEKFLKHIENNSRFIEHNKTIFEILEGDLLDKIIYNMRKILISERAFQGAIKQIPPINILRQINSKLSTIYSEPPVRTAELESDQFLIDFYVDSAELNTSFNEANKFFNSQKVAAIEPFLDNGVPSVRVISGHHFLPYSNNAVNPLRMTEFIKFIGDDLFFIYSKDEFKAIDGDGNIVPEFMAENNGINPFGVIPQTYIKRSRNLLMPLRDTDTVQMSVLLPSMWASLNYGINFQAHSLMYGIDIDFENIEMNQDSFLVFKSEDGKTPQLGSIKPDIDIAEVDKHILDMFNAWLESMNIRPGESVGSTNSLSGVALSIKEMGTAQNRREQIRYFKEAESDFWYKLKHIHNYWVDSGKIKNLARFSDAFAPSTEFAKIDITEDEDKAIDKEVKKLNNGLTTQKRAIQKLNPDMTSDEVDDLLLEIEKDKVTVVVPEIELEE